MGPRKGGGLSPQERLARLAGAARPLSEREESSASETPAPSSPEAGAPDDTSSLPDPDQGITPGETSHVPPHVTGVVTPHEPVDTPPHVTGDGTGHVTSHVTDIVTPQGSGRDGVGESLADGPEYLTERIRGRWTREHTQFLSEMAKQNRTTVGEILRHILSWYMAIGRQTAPPISERIGPSAWVARPRETGLTVKDFLTTPSQASAFRSLVKAVEVGEAALLRQAVDVYRERGPLVHGQHLG